MFWNDINANPMNDINEMKKQIIQNTGIDSPADLPCTFLETHIKYWEKAIKEYIKIKLETE